MIYALIALLATALGALVGLGGGIIIKPALVAISSFDLFTIGILSSLTVFSMAFVSLTLRLLRGLSIDRRVFLIGASSIAGGFLGKLLLSWFLERVDMDFAQTLQSFIMLGLLLLVLWLSLRRGANLRLSNPLIIGGSGVLLGVISTFLGIGGGPLNVALFLVLFSFTLDQAVISSIFLILLSQGTLLTSTLIDGSFSQVDLSVAPYLLIGGITGAVAGTYLSGVLGKVTKERAFIIAIIGTIFLNIYNILNV